MSTTPTAADREDETPGPSSGSVSPPGLLMPPYQRRAYVPGTPILMSPAGSRRNSEDIDATTPPIGPLPEESFNLTRRSRVRFNSIVDNGAAQPEDPEKRDPEKRYAYDTESEDEEEPMAPLDRYFAHRASVNNGSYAPEDTDLESGAMQTHGSRPRGLLGLMLRLHDPRWEDRSNASTALSTPALTPTSSPPASLPTSGTTTPRQFFSSQRSHSANSLSAYLLRSSPSAASDKTLTEAEFKKGVEEKLKAWKEEKRQRRQGMIAAVRRLAPKKAKKDKIKSLIAETVDKHQYLVTLCRALIRYGAPTHRLEAYMRTSAGCLNIAGQFLYIPGCMIISFDDPFTHTTEVRLVREDQGVDLGRMDSVHNIYKRVANGDVAVSQGRQDLDDLMARKPQHPRWLLVLMYGFAAASVGPFAFQAGLIDTPIAFVLGAIVGLLQYYLNPVSELWANCFTIFASLITSALARIFGSVSGGNIFCFSALAQSSIALILPGYTVLCSALELQSGSIVAGSIRLVYALIYSLYLGFGITIGSAIVGAVYPEAASGTTCPSPLPNYWYFLSVPIFTLCLIVINQAKWKQAPVQMIVSLAGYQVNFWVSQHIKGQAIANAAGAFTVGLLANAYGRFGYTYEQRLIRWFTRSSSDAVSTTGPIIERVTYGLAAATMLPAIWVQVPSGLAVSGSLVSGIESANQITGSSTGVSVASNANDQTGVLNSAVLTVGYSVIQIAVGITVGLFISTVIVYPRGKKKGALFSM